MDETVQLKQLGCDIVEITLPKTELAIPAYYVIAPAESQLELKPL